MFYGDLNSIQVKLSNANKKNNFQTFFTASCSVKFVYLLKDDAIVSSCPTLCAG